MGTIDPGAVRIEEMLNYFDYDYAAPAEGEDFALTARAGACPWNAESELVVLRAYGRAGGHGGTADESRAAGGCVGFHGGTPRSFRF